MKCALNDLNRSSISNTVANDQKATKGDPDKERVKQLSFTMSTTSNINYIDTYFEFKELTKIHGEPTYDTLRQLHNQLRQMCIKSVKVNKVHSDESTIKKIIKLLSLSMRTPRMYLSITCTQFT